MSVEETINIEQRIACGFYFPRQGFHDMGVDTHLWMSQ
jgi:hypothetical protein